MLLAKASSLIEAGELGVTVPMRGDDELGRLGKAFTSMSLRLEELIKKTYKEEIALRDARIQAMQSRINPHFINNALESINWEARIEGSETISAMVESLSVLLNASMSRNDRRIVTLKEELEVAKAYFYFVGLSYGDTGLPASGCAAISGVPGSRWSWSGYKPAHATISRSSATTTSERQTTPTSASTPTLRRMRSASASPNLRTTIPGSPTFPRLPHRAGHRMVYPGGRHPRAGVCADLRAPVEFRCQLRL